MSLSAFWERGSPDFPACGVVQRGPSTPHLHQHKTQDPREGPILAGRTARCFLGRGLIRLAHKEAERSRWAPHEVPMTQAMTTKGARREPARAVPTLSSLVQRRQAQ